MENRKLKKMILAKIDPVKELLGAGWLMKTFGGCVQEFFEEAIERMGGYYEVAEALEEAGFIERARLVWRNAAAYETGEAAAMCYFCAGEKDKAVELAENAVLRGDFEEAAKIYGIAGDSLKEQICWVAQADKFAEQGIVNMAVSCYIKAANFSKVVELLLRLEKQLNSYDDIEERSDKIGDIAYFYRKIGDVENALRLFSQGGPEFYQEIAELLEDIGALDEARKYFELADCYEEDDDRWRELFPWNSRCYDDLIIRVRKSVPAAFQEVEDTLEHICLELLNASEEATSFCAATGYSERDEEYERAVEFMASNLQRLIDSLLKEE